MKCAAGKAHVDTKSTEEEETDQEMDYCLGTYHLLPGVPVQSFGTKMDKFIFLMDFQYYLTTDTVIPSILA